MSNRLSLRQLRAFHAVMNGGSLSAAADLLNLTMPSVSKQLTGLENELGIELFVRQRGRALTPTRNGIELFEAVETTISDLNNLRHIASEIVESGRRSLRLVATAPLINSEPLIQALSQFRKENDEIRISLELRSRLDIEKWDNMRHVEFAVAMLPTSNPNLRAIPLIKTRAVAVLSKEHILAGKEILDPDTVRGQPILMQNRRLLRSRIDAVHKSHGYELLPVMEPSSSFTCCRLASAGLGIAISDPFSPSSAESSSMVVREWQPEITLEYGVLVPRDADLSPMGNQLKDLIVAQMAGFTSRV